MRQVYQNAFESPGQDLPNEYNCLPESYLMNASNKMVTIGPKQFSIISSINRFNPQCCGLGFIPSWVNNRENVWDVAKNRTFVPAELVQTIPTYAEVFKTNRCIAFPINATRQHIQNLTMGIGGVLSIWKDKNSGEEINTFSIITIEVPRERKKGGFNIKRMPLEIQSDKWDDWLNPNSSLKTISEILSKDNENT